MKRRRRRKRHTARVGGLIFFLVLFACIGTASVHVLPELLSAAEETVTMISKQGAEFPELTVTVEDVESGFYYGRLTEHEQTIYREMLQGITGMEECIRLHAGKNDDTAKVYEYLLCDRPEIFWCDGNSRMTVYNDYTEMYPGYTCTLQQKDERKSEIETASEECLRQASAAASEYERIKCVYEYLVDTVDYDGDAPDNQNIYSALVGKRSVCAGYSRAAQYLLGKLGTECIYVTGNIKGQGAHAWNIVKCGDNYYHMDVTFGDPVFLGEESGENIPDNVVNYDYLCCTDSEIMTDHEMDTEPGYPPCASDDLNYYRLNGTYYESYDEEQILEAMTGSINAGDPVFMCKFADSSLYSSANRGLVEKILPEAAQYLASRYGLERVKYTYSEDPEHNKFSVFWIYQ